MARIIAIDYGKKRCGLAWTDPLQMIATRLEPCPTPELEQRLAKCIATEEVETLVLGYPTRTDGSHTHATAEVEQLAQRLRSHYPDLKLELFDERFSTQEAKAAMLAGGAKKKKRQDKALINSVAATIILQHYLESIGK